jgi:hypothetical protein
MYFLEAVDLCMDGTRAATRNVIARFQIGNQRPDLHDDPGRRIAERGGRLDARSNRPDRLSHAFPARRLDYLRSLIGPRARLSDQTLASCLHLCPLGARAQQARANGDEHSLGRHDWRGHIRNLDVPIA